MKNRKILALLGIFALGGALYASAQDYDDIYYDASKATKKETVKKSSGSVSLTEQTMPTTVRTGKSTVTTITSTPYQVTVTKDGYRDDDEYNRRGAYDPSTLNDTTYNDDEGSFSNTQRIERFYNPDIIIASNDDELITLYYEDQPTVNLIIGSNWGPSYGWGWSSIYYDPWYSSYPWGWYQWNGWYGPSWYYNWHYGWHHGIYGWGYWNGWGYRPWSSWGWHYGWNHWGYGHHYGWDRGWDRGRWNYSGGRRPSSVGLWAVLTVATLVAVHQMAESSTVTVRQQAVRACATTAAMVTMVAVPAAEPFVDIALPTWVMWAPRAAPPRRALLAARRAAALAPTRPRAVTAVRRHPHALIAHLRALTVAPLHRRAVAMVAAAT